MVPLSWRLGGRWAPLETLGSFVGPVASNPSRGQVRTRGSTAAKAWSGQSASDGALLQRGHARGCAERQHPVSTQQWVKGAGKPSPQWVWGDPTKFTTHWGLTEANKTAEPRFLANWEQRELGHRLQPESVGNNETRPAGLWEAEPRQALLSLASRGWGMAEASEECAGGSDVSPSLCCKIDGNSEMRVSLCRRV